MCTGSQMKDCTSDTNKEGMASTNLLELAAADDLSGFKVAVEDENGIKIDQAGIWYGRKIGSKQMAFEERTPLMIASMFGSKHVVEYILQHDGIDVNKACGSDGATALHCAVSGGSNSSYDVVKLLLDASADFNSVDANGKRPADLLSPGRSPTSNHGKKMSEGCDFEDSLGLNEQNIDQTVFVHQGSAHYGIEKKEYPVDPTLPDIKNGVCGTDEFRMYTFKVKPCSRAYSHDWTECPFVHPGENARRRDPRKYHYSCVPCPEFRKGMCSRGDICEYAHGIFESWLHPAQYRTRLCKDETNCSRRVCFFAHKPEELRLLYAASGSAAPSPRSFSSVVPSALDLSSISPLSLGLPLISTPPLTPSGGTSIWGNKSPLVSKNNRMKSSRIARDFHMDDELLELKLQSHHTHQQFLDDFNSLSSVEKDIFENIDSTLLSQLHGGLTLNEPPTQLLSPKRMHLRRSTCQSSSPVRPPSYGNEISGKTALKNTKATSFANRSQSFIERGIVTPSEDSLLYGSPLPSPLSDWSSPDGKLDWGIQKEDINNLRKSSSFGLGKSGNNFVAMARANDDPDVSLVNDVYSSKPIQVDFDQYNINGVQSETQTSWADMLFSDQKQIAA